MLKTIVRRMVCVSTLLSVIGPSANATAILVVVKPDAVWIAADGLRSGGPTKGKFTVCKAHQAYGGVILKYGYNGEASPTTDDVLQKLLFGNKSYVAFKKAASAAIPIFMNSVAASSEAFEVDSEQEKRGQEDNKTVGLVFVGAASGHLFVEQIAFRPTWIQESNIPGHKGQLTYANADWKEIGQEPAAFLFPESLRVPNLGWALEHPDNLVHGALEVMEHETPCFTGPPNLYLKVTIAKPVSEKKYTKRELRDLNSNAVIDPISPGGCPSWAETPIATPPACTLSEELREHQGGSAVQ